MEDSIRRTAARILHDVRHLKNIEIYGVALLGAMLIILDIVGDVSPDLKLTAMLAALILLIFNITVPDHSASSLDELLNDRRSLTAVPFSQRIKGARQLWIYGPSAVNILSAENSVAIKDEVLSHTGGEVRVIIQNPNEAEGMNILVKQIDESIDFRMQDLPESIQQTLQILEKMRKWNSAGQVEYKLLGYSPGFSMVVIDPDKRNGVVIVEFFGFYNEHTANRMNLVISKTDSEYWFHYWVEQFQRMWVNAD
jgi:hypothetical protein